MNRFDACRDSFSNARLTRSKTDVLEVALHTALARWRLMAIRRNNSSTYFTPSVPVATTASSS
jgi:hypothetical protein